MIPLFLLPLVGFLTMEQIQNLFMGSGLNTNGGYNTNDVSLWTLNQVKKSEGLEMVGYAATPAERAKRQFTIGYGTSFLFLANGKPFNNNFPINGANGVRESDTLAALKVKMGYSNLSEKQFAEQLIINHINANSYVKIGKYFESLGLPFIQSVKDTLMEWCYGSGGVHNKLGTSFFNPLTDAIKTRNLDNIAQKYALIRHAYYKPLKAWNPSLDNNALSNRYSWMKRVYCNSMHIRGFNLTVGDVDKLVFSSDKLKRLASLQALFVRNLGIFLDM